MRLLSLQTVLRKLTRTLLPYFHEQPFIPLCQIPWQTSEFSLRDKKDALGEPAPTLVPAY
jgi:hypothetical protein